MDCSTPTTLPSRPRLALLMIALCCTAVVASGCSSGHRNVPYTSDTPATISNQPVDQSIPMGLSATFAVTATGTSLQYQWQKNGAAIAGATGSSYTAPAVTFTDTGSSYTVTVSNADGMVTSNAASLTVTARAPMTGDLRFQQVDAPSTVNGWGMAGTALSTFLPARAAQNFYPSLGTSFYVGSNGNCATPPVTDGTGCSWEFSEVPFAVSSSDPTLLAGYASDLFDNFATEGAGSRVITAISYNAGLIT
jgi:hypothetical protein